jgi:glutamate N-acetyltransferase/amino-acid N-acetyltransferase
LKVSPLAPKSFPEIPAIAGFDMAVAEANIRYTDRTDLWILRCQPGTQIAGVFTKNKAPGAPIDWSRKALLHPSPKDMPRLIITNSGTANVFCGALGPAACKATVMAASKLFRVAPNGIFLSSTGVIGQPLDATKIEAVLPQMKTRMAADMWEESARAIMTTDTYPKGSIATAEIGGKPVAIAGIAKGSGMIAPDMATMLGYIVTDAAIGQAALQTLLSDFCRISFNAISVDSDTSTSDMVLLAASGAAKNSIIDSADDPALEDFKAALLRVMLDLSHQIVKDGEGASKFITVKVTGAKNDNSARTIAMSIANSPLVKTAIAGEDANWGRIVMAVGKSGEPADRDKLTIALGPYTIAENGALSPGYEEAHGADYMKHDMIEISVDLNLGVGHYTAWTCDLTHTYIDINADYRS